MSSDILGVLVVIILRGKNLPNKVRIGKQNPFATISYRSTKKKTTAIERGGQAPEWDEEFRFEIREDGDEGAKVALDKSGGVENVGGGVEEIPPVTPVKRATGTMEKILKIAAWADDPRDPKLIGEVHIDLVPILKKGAKDAWFELERKGKYAGELLLEMTFYSNAPPPVRTEPRPAPPSSASYGGPGGRVEDGDDDEEGTAEDGWGKRLGTRESQASLVSSAAGEFTSDYPDADVGPLAKTDLDIVRSISNMSLQQGPHPPPSHYPSRSYPQSNHPVEYTQDRPVYDTRQASGGSYLPPHQEQPVYEDRRASYSYAPQEPQHYQPPPPPPHFEQQHYQQPPTQQYAPQQLPPPPQQYQNQPPPQQPVYADGGGGFEAVAEQYHQTYSTISQQPPRFSPSPSQYPTQTYTPAPQPPQWDQPPPTTFLPPPPPPPIFSPPPHQFGPPPPPPPPSSFTPLPPSTSHSTLAPSASYQNLYGYQQQAPPPSGPPAGYYAPPPPTLSSYPSYSTLPPAPVPPVRVLTPAQQQQSIDFPPPPPSLAHFQQRNSYHAAAASVVPEFAPPQSYAQPPPHGYVPPPSPYSQPLPPQHYAPPPPPPPPATMNGQPPAWNPNYGQPPPPTHQQQHGKGDPSASYNPWQVDEGY